MKIKFCGTRGSYPVSGEKFTEYGEGTSCVLLDCNGTKIMIDCGTGVDLAEDDLKDANELYLFISHIHVDHISGIVQLASIMQGKKLNVYCKKREGLGAKDAFDRIMSPPLWPVKPEEMMDITYYDIPDAEYSQEHPLIIGNIKVTTMEGNHLAGCTFFRFDSLEDDKTSVTTAFDYGHSQECDERLKKFAKGTKVLIYDGTMSPEEYEQHSDWGHSTPEHGIELAKEIGAETLFITHHGNKSDSELSAYEEKLQRSYPNIVFAKSGFNRNSMATLLEIGTKLSSEKDHDKVLELILRSAMHITHADGGTLYRCEEDGLHFDIMITESMNVFKGGKGDPIDIPPVKYSINNVCAAAVIEKKLINIPDVYHNENYDFSGPRQYDKLTGYRTKSVMVVPMENNYGEIIGVLQLINSLDGNGEILPFNTADEKVVEALASQAAVRLTNMDYSKQVVDLLYGFVRVMSTGIDARTPYNANHTRNMVKYADKFFEYEAKENGPYAVSESEQGEIGISIWLHDIGKLIIPLEVMDKSTRLGDSIKDVENRFGRMKLLLKIAAAKGQISENELEEKLAELDDNIEFIRSINSAGFLPDEKLARLGKISEGTYVEEDGSSCSVLTQDEKTKLSIRKGTLTDEEREIMQSHVTMTSKMLSELDFPRGFENVKYLAGSHHEYIDGSGYPEKISADDLDWKARLITIIDIFEALTAKDRPYKPPMPIEKAFAIMDSMVEEGKLDRDILESFKKSQVE